MEKQKDSWFIPIATLIAVGAAIVFAFIGSGALGGTEVDEAAGGALSADATPLAPDGPAFSIWSVIYVGLALYAIYQLLPAPRSSRRHACLRPWVALSALLNAGWLAVVQADSVWGSVVVIVILLAILLRILLILRAEEPLSIIDTVITDGTLGLYRGWVTVTTTANTAALVWTEDPGTFDGWEWVAVGVIAVVAAAGIGLSLYTRGRIAPAIAISWGLAWVTVGRTTGEFESMTVVWAAAIASAAVLVTAIATRARREVKSSRSS